jgi:hypothetical protein
LSRVTVGQRLDPGYHFCQPRLEVLIMRAVARVVGMEEERGLLHFAQRSQALFRGILHRTEQDLAALQSHELITRLIHEQAQALMRDAAFYCLLQLNAGTFGGYPLLAAAGERFGKYPVLIASFALAALMVPLYAQVRDATLLLLPGPVMAAGFAQTGLLGACFPELFPTGTRSLGARFCFNAGRGLAAFSPYLFGELAAHPGLPTALRCAASAIWLRQC